MDAAEHLGADAPRPRLCHLKKSPDFAGYGFNLHAEKGKAGQFIGKVDDGSPAHWAGLREGDRIIEVNGTNVGSENHTQVVERIKAVPDEVKFLVVDEDTDNYYRDRKIVITGELLERLERNAKTSRSNSDAASSASSKLSDHGHYQLNHMDSAESDVKKAGSTCSDNDAPAPHPRLCELKAWSDFSGYGFNLHADKGLPGQYVGKVDPGSPAEAAGLKDGDRIIEVNGINIDGETHDEVVGLIKSMTGRVSLLVVDTEADDYFRDKDIKVDGSMAVVRRIECPDTNPLFAATAASAFTAKKFDDDDNHSDRVEVDGVPAVAAAARSRSSSRSRSPSPAREDIHENGIAGRDDFDEAHAAIAAAAVTVAVTDAVRDEIRDDVFEHRARLCVVRSWKDGKGYGFNMQAQKNKSGQFVGKVDPASPASFSGLKDKDRIVEVNGKNVENVSHKEVVELIKSIPDEVTLLVVDSAADAWFAEKKLTPSSDKPASFERHVCPDSKPEAAKYRARLCVVKSWKDGKGYGFSMQAQKGKTGHFIGHLDDDSPAQLAGLDDGDRIIEVNGENVEDITHKEVVEKIKSVPDEVKMLVVNAESDKYFTEKNIRISSKLDVVDHIICPDTKPAHFANKPKADKKKEAKKDLVLDVNQLPSSPTGSTPSTTSPTSPTTPVVIGGIEFAATVEEARRRASRKQKQDVKSNRLSMKDKYELFQKL